MSQGNTTVMRAIATMIGAMFATSASAQSTAFRMSDLDLRDPHIFVNFISCSDVTDTALFGLSVNGSVQTRIQTDTDPADGLLDLSSVFSFDPLNQALASNVFDAGSANCSAPLAGTNCDGFVSSGLAGAATMQSIGSCLQPLAGTLRPYSPAITGVLAPCFVSPAATITLDLAGIAVPLRDARIAGTFNANPPTSSAGILSGFLRASDADAVIIPASLPLIGGLPLSQLLPGGDPPGSNNTNCAAHSDLDVHEGASGWWFYLNFTAPVTPLGALDLLFDDGFEP